MFSFLEVCKVEAWSSPYGNPLVTGTGNGSMLYSTGSRYCIIMCIYHCMPVLDYALSAPAGQLLCTSVDDLPIPEFDNIGMEGVPAVQLLILICLSPTLLLK